MTKAIREPDVEQYLELARTGNYDELVIFSDECFGTAEDLDENALNAFANIVLPIIEQEVSDMMDSVTEAPQEVIDAEVAKQAQEAATSSDILDSVAADMEAVADTQEDAK